MLALRESSGLTSHCTRTGAIPITAATAAGSATQTAENYTENRHEICILRDSETRQPLLIVNSVGYVKGTTLITELTKDKLDAKLKGS
jgi:hypothetical protein